MPRPSKPFATALLLMAGLFITLQPMRVFAEDVFLQEEVLGELTIGLAVEDAVEQAADEDTAEAPAPAEQAPKTLEESLQQAVGDLSAPEKKKPEKKLTVKQKKKAAEQKKKQKKLSDKEKLAKIVLPKNPTRKQCEAYMAKLRKHVEGRNSFSSNDDEIAKIKAVPLEHIDLVLNEMSGHGNLSFYARYAIRNVEMDEHQDAIIKNLDSRPANILFVVQYGWFQKAKPTILNRLENTDPSKEVQAAWFQAFAEVAEKKHYRKLHEIAVRSREIAELIPLLEMLPEYDLAHTINEAWKGTGKNERDYYLRRKRETLAPYAAGIGNVEALGMLVESLQQGPSYNMRMENVNQERVNIIRRIDFRGTDKEIKDWYDANKDQLVFDTYRKRFVVQEPF